MTKFASFLRNTFTFELLFILFLFAGKYKGDPRFAWVPVDLTALFFGLSVLCGIYVLAVNGFALRPSVIKLNIIYLTFVIYAFATYIWTPGEIYATEKLLYLATLTYWPLLATSAIISNEYQRLKRFLIMMVVFACWMSIETFATYMFNSEGWRVATLAGNYLGVGRVLGPAAIVVLMYVLFFTRSVFARIAGTVVFGFFLYVQLVTGGRGPLIAVIVPALLPLVASIKFGGESELRLKRAAPYLIGLIVIAAGGVAYLMNIEDTPMTLKRFNELFTTAGGGSSAQARLSFYTTSLNLWVSQPLWGYGVGSWPVIVEFMDYQSYPHNIVLETMFEFGLVGLVIMATLFIYGLWQLGSWHSVRNHPLKLLVLMIFLNALLNASFSGDIPDNRFLFGALGLLLLDQKVYLASKLKRSTGALY